MNFFRRFMKMRNWIYLVCFIFLGCFYTVYLQLSNQNSGLKKEIDKMTIGLNKYEQDIKNWHEMFKKVKPFFTDSLPFYGQNIEMDITKIAQKAGLKKIMIKILDQSIIFQDDKISIIKIPVRISLLMESDHFFWAFIDMLWTMMPGITAYEFLSLEKINDKGAIVLKGGCHIQLYKCTIKKSS